MELDDNTHERITLFSKEGNRLFDRREYDEAIRKFKQALDHLPEPKSNWDASVWLYTAIGDAYFMKKEYENAMDNVYAAYNCGAVANPFINLRIGQCFYELKQTDQAVEFLLRAYMLDGEKIFRGAKKYFTFLGKNVEL